MVTSMNIETLKQLQLTEELNSTAEITHQIQATKVQGFSKGYLASVEGAPFQAHS
jgi:hypothetical protein